MSMVDSLIRGVTQGLIDRLGINPEQLKAGFQNTVADAARVKNEVLAAKQGFIQVTSAFKAQLDRIEIQNAEILRRFNTEIENGDDRQDGPEQGHRENGHDEAAA